MNAVLMLMILVSASLPAGAAQTSDKLATVANLQSRMDLNESWDSALLRMSPMQREIKAVVDSSRLAEAAIWAGFNRAQDDGGALGAKYRVAELRRQTQQRILEIQARHARLEGRDDLLRRIEASLAALRNPAERRRTETTVISD